MKFNKVEPPVHSLKNYKMKLNKVELPRASKTTRSNKVEPQKLQDEA